MNHSLKRALLLIGSIICTFIVLRVSLIISPNSNFDIGPYNIHHLFTGLIVLSLAVMPLLLFESKGRLMDLLVILFGARGCKNSAQRNGVYHRCGNDGTIRFRAWNEKRFSAKTVPHTNSSQVRNGNQ